MSEKRKNKRIAVKGLAQINLPDGRSYATYVANLSRGGMGIFSKEPLEEGAQLMIKLFYEDRAGKMKTQEVEGQVKWMNDGFFAHGIAIEALNQPEHKDLLAYIESEEVMKPIGKR